MKNLVIAIDGPSGVGKSTLGKALARHFNFLFIDSGAIYRAVALKALHTNTPLADAEAVTAAAHEAQIKLEGDPEALRVYLDGADVSQAIRAPEVSQAASVVATIPTVRDVVVDKLRDLRRAGGLVMDGRDIGTRVFPDAEVKLFLEASPVVRAERRWREELEKGREVTLEQVKSEIEERDRRDRTRAATPLVKAADAILIDTSSMSVEKVISRVLEIIQTRG
jgi:cytidylate kinase